MSRVLRRPTVERALTRADVCQAALDLVDEEGLEALSMRRLGARLGIEAMSLYHHVRDKADLLDALHAAVLGRLEPEGAAPRRALPSGWRTLLGGLCRALRSTLLRHPNVVPLFTRKEVRAPEALGTLERVGAALAAAGFDAEESRRAIWVVGMFTIGHVIFETSNDNTEAKARRNATFEFGLEALLDGVARTAPRQPARNRQRTSRRGRRS
jgi:AcrR family transcriptional regulator